MMAHAIVTASERLEAALREIRSFEEEWLERALQRQNRLTKPPGSLGRMEEIANQLCAIQQSLRPAVEKPCVVVFAGDHGVCEERVNPYPQAVTRQMVANFLAGGAAINAFARAVGAELVVVDAGIIGPPIEDARLVTRRSGSGTRNMCREAAMSGDEAAGAIAAGMDIAQQAIQNGSNVLALGEMGIGNTTAASAICCALTGQQPMFACGRGAGSDDAGLARKVYAVTRALELHRAQLSRPFEILARLGGFEIAALCGACLEAARRRCAVVIDGFISSAAAALAVAMQPAARDYLFAAHESVEPGHRALLDYLQLQPLLQLGMRLGEGTGAALAIPLLRAAAEAFRCMETFESAGVSEARKESPR